MLVKAGMADVEDKEELALIHSAGRTRSLTAMTYSETQSLIAALREMINQPEGPNEKMKRKILSLAHEMKWHKPGTRKVDMKRVNNWCIAKGFNKPLDDLNYAELPKAVTMFNAVYMSYLNAI